MASERGAHSDLAVPPGEYLTEVIGELGMTKDELARRMGRPATKLSSIFKGTKAITPDTAMQLEKVVGVPANVWLGLESEYRLALAHIAEKNQLAAETKLLTPFCYNRLAELGFVRKLSNRSEKVRELQRFLGVATLASVSGVRQYQAAFRVGKAGARATSPHALASWLRMGELRARGVVCRPFDRPRLEASLDKIRGMTLQMPDEFQTALDALLAECGVALVVVPHFSGTRAHGATFWLARDKAVLMLTIRRRWADIFWFSLFHELGHILLHGQRDIFIENDSASPGQEREEEEANTFAADRLVPPLAYSGFVDRANFYHDAVAAFAGEIGVDVGIVVGRLQHDSHLRPEWLNELRKRYTWGVEAEDKS